jgi:tRNA(Ile)-lysidine synthase
VLAANPDATAVADDELESLFAFFPPAGRLILAVSGGADSTALLVLAHRWRTGRAQGPELIVATVDHGLRAGSRAEAEQVCALAVKLGLPHELLRWTGAKPPAGIEAAARNARYALLAGFARQSGAAHLALAHTLDDQAETVLMRLAAGSAPGGLAGMRPKEMRDGVALLRPFLGIRKERLVATLRRDGIAWTEDPTNADPRFARARLRGASAVLAREGLTPERLARLAERMARYEDVVAGGAEAARELLRHPDRPARLNGGALVAVPTELALRVLAAEIREMAGDGDKGSHPVRLHRLEALWTNLHSAIVAEHHAKCTLGGALITVDPDRSVLITRAPARRAKASGAASQAQTAQPPAHRARRG